MTIGTNEATDVASPAGLAGSPTLVDARVVHLSVERAVVPPECACCGAPAPRSMREARALDAAALLVPYCMPCHRHASRAMTRRLAIGMSGSMLALTLWLALPVLGWPQTLTIYWTIVAIGASLPFGAAFLVRRRRLPGHAAAARAAWFRLDGALVCVRAPWAERLAAASNAPIQAARVREPSVPTWAVAVVAVVVAGAPFVHRYQFPAVRVVNVTDGAIVVSVDDRPMARVEATIAESAHAGVSLRIPAGTRRFVATDSTGAVVDSAEVVVRAGTAHLYAPSSRGTCFWVETAGYGRSRGADVERTRLSGDAPFWALSEDIDLWFSAPPASDADGRSTGGVVRALRQAPCPDAPRDVQ